MTTIPLPASEQVFGCVVGQVIRGVGDGNDADVLPEAIPAQGSITFTPDRILVRASNPSSFVAYESVTCTLDNTGKMTLSNSDRVWLPVGSYTVSFSLNKGSISSFKILVTKEHTHDNPLDLVTAQPYTPPSGVLVQTILVPAGIQDGALVLQSGQLSTVDLGSLGGGGGSGGVTDHGLLTGLADDDHPQYLTNGRGDARYAARGRKVEAGVGLSGGGDLTADRTLSVKYGTTAGTAAQGNDARLSDSRTPLEHSHVAADVTDFAETVRDTIAAALVSGSGVTITPNDASDTITIASTGGGGLSGTGSPEGVVSASVGAIYTDTAATQGAVLWVKGSGSGSTGWQVYYGDTGWRDVKASFSALAHGMIFDLNGTATKVLMRRVNATVYYMFIGFNAADTTKHDKIGTIPNGFKGLDDNDNRMFPVVSDTAILPLGQIGMREGNTFQFWFNATGNYRACHLQWVTAQPWPTTLPGTAV